MDSKNILTNYLNNSDMHLSNILFQKIKSSNDIKKYKDIIINQRYNA